jgi:uncharacterized protein (DUF433 family)
MPDQESLQRPRRDLPVSQAVRDAPEQTMLFSVEQVSRLTGLKKGRLAYWHSTDFYTAEHAGEPHRAYGRVYSFLDLVALRTLALLVNQHRVYLGELRKVAKELSDRRGDWAGFKFLVGGRKVFWIPRGGSDQDIRSAHPPGQTEMRVAMDEITRDVQRAVADAKRRSDDEIGKIEQHRAVAQNAHVLAGTRIPTLAVWSFHQEGYDSDEIQLQYPRLMPADIDAAITFERRRHAHAG